MIRRFFQVLPAGLDALIAGMFSTFLVTLPMFVGWLTQLANGASWIGYWRFAAGSWLLANNVPYELSHSAIKAIPEFASFGLTSFVIELAPLTLTLLIVQQAWSAGRRIAGLDLVWPSIVAGLLVYVAYVVLVSSTVHWLGSQPTLPWLVVGPVLTYGIPLTMASFVSKNEIEARSFEARSIRRLVADATARAPLVWAVFKEIWALSVRWLLGLVVVASAMMGIALIANWFTVGTVYQQLHVDLWGALGLTLGQLLYIPNAIIAMGAWICGGTVTMGGTVLSMFDAPQGAIPAIPLLSIIPTDFSKWHILLLVIPCAALASFATLYVRGSTSFAVISMPRRVAVIVGAALVTAVISMLAGWVGSGIVGAYWVGPVPWTFGLAVFVQTTVAGCVGVTIAQYLFASEASGRVG